MKLRFDQSVSPLPGALPPAPLTENRPICRAIQHNNPYLERSLWKALGPSVAVLCRTVAELTVVGSDNAGRYVNRVHPLDQFLVGLLFQVLADVQVVLYKIGRLSQVGRTGSVLAKAG